MAGKRQPLNAWRYSGLGVELVGAVAALAAVGYWIDRRFDSSPWGVLVGAGIGIVGGMWNLIRVGLRASREQNSRNDAGERE